MKKVPLFQPFKSVNQAFERLADIIEKVENDDAKYHLIIWYGCFNQTYNEHIEKLYDRWANGEDDDDVEESES